MKDGRSLIDKLIHSELTNEERFELEKRALDDDFLATAYEGFHESEKAEVVAALNRLKVKIQSKKEEKKEAKVVPFYRKLMPYAAAASLALVLGSLWFYNQDSTSDLNTTQEQVAVSLEQPETPSFQNKQEDSNVKEEPKTDITSAAPIPQNKSKSTTPSASLESRSDKSSPRVRDENIAIARSNSEPEDVYATSITNEESQEKKEAVKKEVSVDAALRDIAIADIEKVDEQNAKKITFNKTPSPKPSVVEKTALVAEASSEMEEASLKELENSEQTISGVILGPSGEALIGANLNVLGSDEHIVSNLDGSFSLSANADDDQLRVTYTGYESQLIKLSELDNLEDIKINLVAGLALSEEVVISDQATDDAGHLNEAVVAIKQEAVNARKRSFIQEAAPTVGLSEWNKIIAEKTTITKEDLFMIGLKSPYEIAVIFDTDNNGLPKNITVPLFGKKDKSSLRKKIISLFKEGGAWNQSNTKDLRHIFDLPIK